MLSSFRFALVQYQKAIQCLRTFIDGLQKGKGGRSTLICCMVLTLFDCFFGNVGFAAQHIRFGRKLLSTWLSNETNDRTHTQIMDDEIDSSLIDMFVSIDIQAAIFINVDKEYTYPNALSCYRLQPSSSQETETLEEAQSMKRVVFDNGYNTYLRTLQYKATSMENIPLDLIHLRDYHISQIRLWNSRLEELSRGEQLHEEVHPLSQTNGLRLRLIILLIRLYASLGLLEPRYDDLSEYFEYLLFVSKRVIKFETRDARLISGQ